MEFVIAMLIVGNICLFVFVMTLNAKVNTLKRVMTTHTAENKEELIRIWEFLERLTKKLEGR